MTSDNDLWGAGWENEANPYTLFCLYPFPNGSHRLIFPNFPVGNWVSNYFFGQIMFFRESFNCAIASYFSHTCLSLVAGFYQDIERDRCSRG